jgi:hypothetical protein
LAPLRSVAKFIVVQQVHFAPISARRLRYHTCASLRAIPINRQQEADACWNDGNAGRLAGLPPEQRLGSGEPVRLIDAM